jgi:membrane fusion protein, multidrug efflux system
MKTNHRMNLSYPLIGLALLGMMSGCETPSSEAQTSSDKKPTVVETKQPETESQKTNVEVLMLSPQNFSKKSTYIGYLIPLKRLMIKSEVEGVVESVFFKEGEKVRENQVLIKIGTKQLTISQNQSRSNFDLAESNFKRDQHLFQKQLIPSAQLEQSLNQKEVAFYTLEQAKLNLEKASIQVPFSGVVKSKNVEVGDFINKGQLIAEILDIHQLKALVYLPGNDLRFMKAGVSVDVALDAVDETFKGRVTSIGWEADPQSRSFPVEVLLENSKQLLRAGMLARVQAQTAYYENQVIVPRHALLERETGPVVYVVQDHTAQVRPVIVGESLKDSVQITSGLKFGDIIVVSGQNQVRKGASVVVQNTHTQTSVAGRF